MNKITKFAVEYPVTIAMFVLAILLLGYISLGKLGVDLFPELDAPRIFIEIKAGERPPEEIEKQFVENIESQVIRQKGVSDVSSVCMVGAASITVEYNWGSDMDEAFLDLQKALSAFSQNTAMDEFTITQHDPNASPIMVIAIVNPEIQDMDEFRKVGQNYIRNELIRLDGIADVKLTGIEEKELVIETDEFRLKSYNVTINQIVQQIQNLNRNASGGSVVEMGKKYIIKGTSLLEHPKDVENIIITYKGNAGSSNTTNASTNSQLSEKKVPVFLKDMAKVSLINKKAQNIVHINGKRCMGLSVYKETGFNTVKAIESLNKALVPIKNSLPGYEFNIVQNQGKFVQDAVNEVKNTAILGAILSVFVLFFFLRKIGLTIIVSAAIPISVIATFNLMYFNGLSLNIMTLGGLALGAGMLVDNAIVVMENMYRTKETGLSVKDSAIIGSSQVSGAIISSTLTTIVVFLPIVYLHGASGELFKDQAWTVTFSLLASLFVAILVIPMLFNISYGKTKDEIKINSVQLQWYTRLLSKILAKRKLVLALSMVLLIASVLILPLIGTEFIPKSTTGEFTIELKLEEGTQIESTAAMVDNLETMLTESIGNQVDMIYSTVGPANLESTEKSIFQNENTASIKIRLKKEFINNSELLIEKASAIIKNIGDIEVTIVRDETALLSIMGNNNAALSVYVKGEELNEIENLSETIKKEISTIPGLINVKTSLEEGAPEIDIVIDRFKAGMYNLSANEISSQLQDILMGKDAGKYEKEGEMNNIVVKMPEIGLMEFMNLKLKNGQKEIPLYELGEIKQSFSPKQIHRKNQSRIGIISADIDKGISFNKAVSEVNKKIVKISRPEGYEFSMGGEEQKRKEAMINLKFALLLSVILVYMVMAAQFESLLHPFTILLTIPLAATGAVWAFFLLGKSLNIMAFIGIIMLGGIAVNNSILLVDAINQFRNQGHSLHDSILKAGQNRIRPILMTSLTTILGLIPLTLGIGESTALRAPMAIAVIAGLSTSTLMSLVVIPCIYYVFESLKERIKKPALNH